jgi:hypothetical protein
VSGFARNGKLNELLFYDLAKYVLEQDGYVHWAWWNNLLKEYMARPLHRTETYQSGPNADVEGPHPGDPAQVSTLVPGTLQWKAVPEEDTQFQADALRMLQAIRSRHPDALIIVAGHSMGGAAVARLGINPNLPAIDLLAPIDPVGNRSNPVGQVGSPSYNWTRWRATYTFRGYKSVDCERNLVGACKNVGTFLLPSYNCQRVGDWQPRRSMVINLAPLYCPAMFADPGTRYLLRANVRRLYHRWQSENEFPFDYTKQYTFNHPATANNVNLLTSRNYQRAVPRNAALEKNPDKTCHIGADPRDSSRICSDEDGHGEIIGLRVPTPGQPGTGVPFAPLAIGARDWPTFDQSQPNGHATSAERRSLIVEMKTASSNWPHRPIDPGMCMVSADMRAIVQHLLGGPISPPEPPVTTVDVAPNANDAGWHNEPVTLTFTPSAAAGATVTGLTVTLTGAQTDIIETDGSPAEVVIDQEGMTVVTWSARDSALRVEAPQTMTIRLDRTPPVVTAEVTPPADVEGWHTGEVLVTFTANDPLSGVETVTPPVTVASDGAGQEVVGTAVDQAGNVASALVTLNIDSTRQTLAQNASTWLLAEGADNATFAQEILVGNPSDDTVDVTVTLLPQPDATVTHSSRTFTLAPTSRLTVRPATDQGLNGSSSARVSAVISGTSTPADIVVERTMYFPDDGRPGAHNAGGVAQAASAWTLAEGATTIFDTFVLVANANATETLVRATYLTGAGEEYVSEQMAPANGRITFWPRAEHPALQANEFSTFVESMTSGNDVIAERAMYFDNLRAGHDAVGVATPSTTWYFAEGFTGGSAQTAFETFVLLANTGNTAATVSIDYLLDSGEVVTRPYAVPARSRFTVWVDQEGRVADARLANASFGLRITADQPIVAERAMYWGTPSAGDPTTPALPWAEGHATAGATGPASRWAFAEGQQGTPGAPATPGVHSDSFFLLANPNPATIAVRATFVREDGRGIVRETCVGPHTRANIWTAVHPELAGHRFATFLESVASTACGSGGGELFVAERALYLGAAFDAGHVNMGTPWPGTIAAPPPP